MFLILISDSISREDAKSIHNLQNEQYIDSMQIDSGMPANAGEDVKTDTRGMYKSIIFTASLAAVFGVFYFILRKKK